MHISLQETAQLLIDGGVAAVPTETVYGLAASIHCPQAIEQIFALKGRPLDNPLIIHVADPKDVISFVTEFPPGFDVFTNHFWPGPLTIVLPIDPHNISSKIRAGLPTAAFRVPAHPLTQQLLRLTGPLVMPSANLSGRPSSTKPEHIEYDFGGFFPVLDGGPCSQGVESTIIIYQNDHWQIIRLGAISFEELNTLCPILLPEKLSSEKPLCPGQKYRHYSPKARLLPLDQLTIGTQGVIIGFTERNYPANCRIIYLGSIDQPQEVAENLYSCLRQLDEEDIDFAWIDRDFPKNGVWRTLKERINKAIHS